MSTPIVVAGGRGSASESRTARVRSPRPDASITSCASRAVRVPSASTYSTPVIVRRLRDTVPRGGVRRQPVALDDHDVLEIRRQRARRGETAHAGADDDGSLSDGRHSYLTCFTMTGSHSLSASPGRSAGSAVW